MSLFSSNKSNAQSSRHETLLDQPLYEVPGTGEKITWADSIEGTLILGSTGSGKTSGPAKHAGLAMLKAGFGFCILCAKPEEKDRWVKYAEKTNRTNDLVIFNRRSGLQFNFLEYELVRDGEGAGEILNMINALMSLNEQNRLHQSGGDGKEEKFWDNSLRRLISRCISILVLAGEEVSIYNMRKIVSGCFRGDDFKIYQHLISLVKNKDTDPSKRKEAVEELDLWAKSNFFLNVLQKLQAETFISPDHEEESLLVQDYWTKEFPNISERTQSIIVETFNGVVEPWFGKGILKEHFAGGLSEELWPENIVRKKSIVIIDFPVKEFGLAGIYAASIYKTAFQSMAERRNIEEEENPTPVALMIDEYQTFCSPLTDSLFQVTARSSWVACCFITQNINNIYFVMGSSNPIPRAKSLLGNLNLKYFASQSDYDTNKWAAEMIGQHMVNTESVTVRDRGGSKEVSKAKNQQMMFRFTPDEFTTLKTGRKKNNFIVEAVVFKAGKTWGKEKENYAIVSFDQRS